LGLFRRTQMRAWRDAVWTWQALAASKPHADQTEQLKS
jgi:hypothetical protein